MSKNHTQLTIVVSAIEPKLLINMLQVTLTGGPAGWGIDNTLTRWHRTEISQNARGLTIVVSVTEPKLLIKILHVTFTGGPVKWNDNEMTRECLKPYHQGRLGFGLWSCFIRKFGYVGYKLLFHCVCQHALTQKEQCVFMKALREDGGKGRWLFLTPDAKESMSFSWGLFSL